MSLITFLIKLCLRSTFGWLTKNMQCHHSQRLYFLDFCCSVLKMFPFCKYNICMLCFFLCYKFVEITLQITDPLCYFICCRAHRPCHQFCHQFLTLNAIDSLLFLFIYSSHRPRYQPVIPSQRKLSHHLV